MDAFMIQRARLTAAQAVKAERDNALAERQLAPMDVIVGAIARSAAHAADVLDGIPLAVKRRMPEVDHRLLKVIEQEVLRARTIAAGAKMPESVSGP